MNRKMLPRMINKRYNAIAGIIEARGNGGNASDILYNEDSKIIKNRLFKNSPSSVLSTPKKKWWELTLLDQKLNNQEQDIWKDYNDYL